MAVIKCNGYGHGLVETAKRLEKMNVYGFAVGRLQEAVELRENGIKCPISKENVDLTELVSGEEILLNPYGAILVDPEVNPNVKYDYAKTFIAFLVSKEGQELIGDFRKNGEKLFKPLYGICDEINDCSMTEEEIEYWEDYNGEYRGPSSDASLITRSFL